MKNHGEYITWQEEQELFVKAQRGDTVARNRIVMSFYKLLAKKAWAMSEQFRCDAEDLLHTALERVIDHFDRFDPSRGFRASTYFGRAAERAMLHAAQTKTIVSVKWGGNKRLYDLACQTQSILGIDVIDESDSAEERVDTADSLKRLRQCLNRLPWRHALILQLQSEGIPLREISRRLRISRGRAQQLAVKARKQVGYMMGAAS